jgi:hypothetical protein
MNQKIQDRVAKFGVHDNPKKNPLARRKRTRLPETKDGRNIRGARVLSETYSQPNPYSVITSKYDPVEEDEKHGKGPTSTVPPAR